MEVSVEGWGTGQDQALDSCRQFLRYERSQREAGATGEKVYAAVDGIILCTQDQTHKGIMQGAWSVGIATYYVRSRSQRLFRAVGICVSLGGAKSPDKIFSTGHVLRYSPHDMLLRKLLLGDRTIAELIPVEHTELVRWLHSWHSYVHGNWLKGVHCCPITSLQVLS